VVAGESVRRAAPAKVNLLLRVLERQASGYHALETLFCAVSLADAVTVRRGPPGILMRVEGGVDTGPLAENLCVRAAAAFHAHLGSAPAVGITLLKRIPAASGLGGGSSDAAATLLALNALHGEPLDHAALLELGAGLGADVPFFLCGSPLALGWGRGERLLALPPLPPRPVLLAHPGPAMPTAEAFRRLAESRRGMVPPPPAPAPDAAALGSWTGVAALAVNDFEPVVAGAVAGVSEILAGLRGAGAAPALLAGSGSCAFGVFDRDEDRAAAAAVLRGAGYRCWTAETLTGALDPSALPG
jgi:4-diphosphocytidyl-2-C-methyl-D-erythritol kinase